MPGGGNGGGADDDAALVDAVAGGAGHTKRVPGDPVVTSPADLKWTTEEVMTSLTGSDFGGGPSGSGGRLLRRLPYSSLLSGSSA